MMRAVAIALVLATTACGSKRDRGASSDEDWLANLPTAPLEVDLGQEPIVNPLNLWDLMVPGAIDYQTVGTIGGEPVTTAQLDEMSGGVLTQIGDRIYRARDDGWRELLEREGLAREAARRNTTVEAMLLELFAKLPTPRADRLDELVGSDYLRAVAPPLRHSMAATLWRWHQYRVMRSVLIFRGLRDVRRERAQLFLISPTFSKPDTNVAIIGDRPITRRELHLASGYQEQELRAEYIGAVEHWFQRRVEQEVAKAAAAARDITVAELDAAIDAAAAPSKADIDRYIAANPDMADNRELAADGARYARRAEVRAEMLAGARASLAPIELAVDQPGYAPIPPRLHQPRTAGTAGAGPTIRIMLCYDTGPCALGATRAVELEQRYGDRARLEAGDSFGVAAPERIRRALAVRCAEEQQLGWELGAALATDPTDGSVDSLVAAGVAVGAADGPMRGCLTSERLLPLVAEDTLAAARLGLAHDVAGVWVDDQRVYRIADPGAFFGEIARAVGDR